MNHPYQILKSWLPLKDKTDWVLALVVSTKGSSYRKSGAMMLFNGLGQSFGLVSGGCLEGDLKKKARKVMLSGEVEVVVYDLAAVDEEGWQPAIGCGGRVDLALIPVCEENGYLCLDIALSQLETGQEVHWSVDPNDIGSVSLSPGDAQSDERSAMLLKPTIQLLICGGGVDARPVSSMALQLGWKVWVNDSRTLNALPEDFPGAQVSEFSLDELFTVRPARIDAVVVMHHNLKLDAAALRSLVGARCSYIGILGPRHRRDKVVALSGVEENNLPCSLFGPMGLNIGGDLPESIALSVLAQIHQALLLKVS